LNDVIELRRSVVIGISFADRLQAHPAGELLDRVSGEMSSSKWGAAMIRAAARQKLVA
jgi:hypothetical protein